MHLGLAQGPASFRKVVAIKTLHRHLAQDERFVAMFLDEARLAARLNHANVVQTFELGEEEGVYFIAMEYVHGVSLSRVLSRGPLPLDVALWIALQATAGLAFAHSARDEHGRPLHLVHRDIAPKNILAAFSGEVKVVDFGVARAADQMHETRTGEIKGTLAYMSPEQLDGDRVDARADVYSTGVTLYELFTGARLFKTTVPSKLFDKSIRKNISPPSTLRGQLPAALDKVIMPALAPVADERYPSCSELLVALRKAAAAEGIVTAPEPLAEVLAERFPKQAAAPQLTPEEFALGSGAPALASSADDETAALSAAPRGDPAFTAQPPSGAPRPAVAAGSIAGADPSDFQQPTASLAHGESIQMFRPPPRRLSPLAIAAVAVIVALAAVVLALRRPEPPPTAASRAAAPAQPPASDAGAAPDSWKANGGQPGASQDASAPPVRRVARARRRVRIRIQTTPPGARVEVNGVDEGTTPLTLLRRRRRQGSIQVLLSRKGYIPARRRVSLARNGRIRVQLLARPKPVPVPVATPRKPPKPLKPVRPPLRVDDLK